MTLFGINTLAGELKSLLGYGVEILGVTITTFVQNAKYSHLQQEIRGSDATSVPAINTYSLFSKETGNDTHPSIQSVSGSR